MRRRLVIVGAGPIGIEAALLGLERGDDVTVLERDTVGASLREWGPTRFFSPFAMNVSPRARAALGDERPADDELLTGPEMVDRVLLPLANGPLAGRVKTGHRVVKIGRDRLLRRDRAGHPMRGERAFRILCEGPEGEAVFQADVVLDASGVALPNYLGNGGVPAVGERGASDDFITTLGALHRRLPELAGRRVLVVGHGHSAANAMNALADFAETHPDIRVVWATRSLHKRPCVEVASDPLPERQRITARANALANQPPEWLTVERRAHVEAVHEEGAAIEVTLSGERTAKYDVVVALVGYRPDTSLLSELAVELSPVTEGSAGIQRALANVTDCLSVPTIGASDLASGESGFHLVGYKSYGRMPTFLLKDGLQQLSSIFDAMDGAR